MEAQELVCRYRQVRQKSKDICKPLTVEDHGLQSVEETSPPKWHLGHTTWFFDRFVVQEFSRTRTDPDPLYQYIFNSYYEGAGKPWQRSRRGLLSRPCLQDIEEYRRITDHRICQLILESDQSQRDKLFEVIIRGLCHEEQHQELLFMDIKHNFYTLPEKPVYQPAKQQEFEEVYVRKTPSRWIYLEGGLFDTGSDEKSAKIFDNEQPRHKIHCGGCYVSARLVSNSEFLTFIEDGGYGDHRWWTSEGWDWVCRNNISSPLYLFQDSTGVFREFTLYGLRNVQPENPACHVSWYEADAFARWAGCRLPTEEEWEIAASLHAPQPDPKLYPLSLHPCSTHTEGQDNPYALKHLYGQVWQWTSSQYRPYPGFKPFEGVMGEYNGKFMCNQFVLRGGACISPPSQFRPTYRNFFRPFDRWQFSGIRLASDSPV